MVELGAVLPRVVEPGIEHVEADRGSRGHVPWGAKGQQPRVLRVHRFDVLDRCQSAEHAGLGHLLRQWAQHHDAADGWVRVEVVDGG